MSTTIRWIDIGVSARFNRITHERNEAHGDTIWCLIGIQKWTTQDAPTGRTSTIEDRIEICKFDTEEECLLAVLALSEGGKWKCRGNTLTGD